MPVGNPKKSTLRTKKYQEKVGYIAKSFKLKKDITDRFTAACKERGESQASVIARMMEEYIAETNALGDME